MKALTLNEPQGTDTSVVPRERPPVRRPVRDRSQDRTPRRSSSDEEGPEVLSDAGAVAPRERLPWKYPKANVRKDYTLTLEFSFVLALGILLFLFRTQMKFETKLENIVTEQEVVQMEEVVQTEQVQKPPPPPRPQTPVAVSDDVILDELDLDLDATLDIDEPLTDLPPPPPAPEEVVEEEEVDEAQIFVAVEEMPELIGGIEALQAKLRYPEVARLAGISGRVFVEFIVDQQGNVTNPVVIRGIGGGCDEEALRVVKDAKFVPGKQRGKPVRVRYVLPIMFVLK